jgi:hypothetical protein
MQFRSVGKSVGSADASGALFELSKKQLLPGTRSVKPAQKITSTSFLCLHFPAFDPAGDLWVSDECRNEISEFTPTQLKTGGSLGPNISISGSMSGPEQIAFDSGGNLWRTRRAHYRRRLRRDARCGSTTGSGYHQLPDRRKGGRFASSSRD